MIMIIALFLFVAFVLHLLQDVPNNRGEAAEHFVHSRLMELNPKHYKVIHDILLPSSGNTTTTQIDHVVISQFGIFCIETKGYQGYISGHAKSKYWTQTIYNYKEKFYSPIFQNYAHTRAMELVIGKTLKEPIIPIITFPIAEKLFVKGTNQVLNCEDTISAILEYTKPYYTVDECYTIYQNLLQSDVNTESNRKEHNYEVHMLTTGNVT